MRLLLWVFLVVSFVIIGAVLISSASGYRYNPKTRRIQKTALLRVRSRPRDVSVVLNGKVLATKTPWEKSRLLPGSYELKLEKPGYSSWIKTIELAPSEARVYGGVVLFKEVSSVEIAEQEQAKLVENIDQPADLYFQGGEIFTADRLITRVSRDVLWTTWYPDKNYVGYQVENEIRIVEFDGSNDIKLVKLSSNKPTVFVFSSDGKQVVFKDDGEVKKSQVLD